MKKIITTLAILSSFPLIAQASDWQKSGDVSVCFTPSNTCLSHVVEQINTSKSSILVSAYALSNPDILKALEAAKARNVAVQIVVDKGRLKESKESLESLYQKQANIYVDKKKAHSKYMVFDDKRVLTGTLNFDKDAGLENVDNLILINDKKAAKFYQQAWEARQKESHPFTPKKED